MEIYCPPSSFRKPGGTLGIVYGSHLYLFPVRDPQPEIVPTANKVIPLGEAASDLPQLIALLAHYKCRSCWLLPQGKTASKQDATLLADFDRIDLFKLNEKTTDWLYQPLTGQHNKLVGITVKQLGRDGQPTGQPYMLYAVWANTFNTEHIFSIMGEGRVSVLAGALLLVSFVLDIQLRYSASWTGQCALREELQSWNKQLQGFPVIPDSAYSVLEQHHARWLLWSRSITSTDDYRGSMYQYDRNWSFVSSAREVPVGQPTRTKQYNPSTHGFYRVTASAPANWNAKLPGIFIDEEGNYPLHVRGVVAWNPQITLALKLGWTVHVTDGYVWAKEQKHDLFRSWQERLWKARRECETLKAERTGPAQDAAAIAVKMIKLIGVSAIGKLIQKTSNYLMATDAAIAEGKEIVTIERSRNFQLTGRAQVREERSSDLYQPGWWSAIIARQTERIQTALYTQATDAAIGTYIDCIYCVRPVEALNGEKLKTGGFRLADVSHPPIERDMTLSPKALATLHKQSKDIPQW